MTQDEIDKLRADASKKCEELVKANAIAAENLTTKQIAAALMQAIQCGDFVRHVRVDNQAQAVTYTPFAQEEELRTQIATLKELLRYVAYLRLPIGDMVFDHLDFNRQKQIHELLI